MGKLNHHAIDNGDINSDIPVESSYDSIPDSDATPIKSIDDGEIDHLLEFFHIFFGLSSKFSKMLPLLKIFS